ncbi:LysR family transcriptional regulator [Shimia sp.]|uniref:LysR family transcriptional regulator n=1 Tax=Shimia sp. TaxID=1954381 RepID=UPI003569033C
MRHMLILKYIDGIAKAGSLRGAAEQLNITPSALIRRIQSVEEELGVEIFERHPSGLRPNIAGEILLKHIRDQFADMDRVKSRIADLSGMRAGHINIAATREVVPFFLPRLLKAHLAEFPAVTFSVSLYERGEAEASLLDNSNDIAVVYEPLRLSDFQTVCSVIQPMYCIMAADHPLAQRRSLKIYDCADYPLLLPKRPQGIRQILDATAGKVGIELKPVLESNSLDLLRLMSQDSEALSFCLAINRRPELAKDNLVAVPVDLQGVATSVLTAGHLRGRTLPVAAARFLETVSRELVEQFEE